jgi:hypothetical protein
MEFIKGRWILFGRRVRKIDVVWCKKTWRGDGKGDDYQSGGELLAGPDDYDALKLERK